MKAQMLVDAVMLFLSISLVTTLLTVFQPKNALDAEAVRYEAQQHQLGLLAALNSFVNFTMPAPDNRNVTGRIVDLMTYYACNSLPQSFSAKLNDSIGDVLRRLNENKHFILAWSVDSASFTAHDWWPGVCMEQISVATTSLRVCNRLIEIQYGTWSIYRTDVRERC